jgi:hypothetical protein
MLRATLAGVLCLCLAHPSPAAWICENSGLAVARPALSLARAGTETLSGGFGEKGFFKVQGLSRKALSLELGGNGGALELRALATNMVDTYWSIISRHVSLPAGARRRYALSFEVETDILLSCGAHENGIWRNLIFWHDGEDRELGSVPIVFSVSGCGRREVRTEGEIPDRAAKFRLQLGFDAPNITPGKRVVYRRLRFCMLPQKGEFVRRGEFVSALHPGGDVSWSADTPENTAIGFQLAAGDSAGEALAAAFVGPDGTSKSYFRKPFKVKKAFMRYRAVLASADGADTPRLKSVTVGGRKDEGWTLLGDCEPPLVHLKSASPFRDAAADLELEAIDGSPVSKESLRLTVDGEECTAKARWEGNSLRLKAPPGGWSMGRHEARVYIADGYGHGREAQKFFYRGDAPATPKVTLRKDGFALVDGKAFFPIGIYDVRKNAFNAWNWDRAVGDLAAAGFNLIHSYGTSAFDPDFRKAIARHGMRHFISSSPWHKSFEDVDRHDPTVLAWYLADDTSRNTTPAELYDRSEAVRAFDPGRLTSHAEHVGGAEISVTRPYVDKIDGLLAEIYPIREDTPQVASNCVARVISDMKRHHADVRESASAPRFIWPIIQYFRGWGSWKRFPTRQELRAMSYAALVHGAHGIVWYKYNTNFEDEGQNRNLGAISSQERWRDLTNLVHEVKTLAPVFVDGTDIAKASCRTVAGAKKDPAGHDAVSFMARRHGGRIYVIAVSSVRSRVKAHFSGICPEGAEVEVLGESRSCRAGNDGGWTDDFSPFAVHLYMFDEKRPPGRPRSGNGD